MSVFTRLLLVLTALLSCPLVAMADGLPKETRKIKILTPEQARKLVAELKGEYLTLSGLTALDVETAKALAEFKGDRLGSLNLNGLTTLDVETAKALAEFKGKDLRLCGLTTLDAGTARALAGLQAWHAELPKLTTLDVTTAKALAEFSRDSLILHGLTTIDADVAKAIAEFKGRALHLGRLRTLDVDTAKALAGFKGLMLHLDGMTALDAAAVNALADFQGKKLSLTGLTTIDADAAKALAQHLEQLTLRNDFVEQLIGELPFNADTASTHAALQNGDLKAVTALDSPDSVAIAKNLAARKGSLRLPNLKRISPKALTALIEKRDVEIPLIETLELIPEPDGSGADDFEIPDWLEERQKRQRAR
jgi:hypothetical protein